MVLKTAIIIAGGKGTRFGDLIADMPKPMIPVGNKPVLDRIVTWLSKNGVKKIVISVAFKKEKIIEYFGDGKKWNVNIKYTFHDMDGGTEDAFKACLEQANLEDENFYAMNADQITDLQLDGFTNFHIRTEAIVSILTVKLKTNFGLMELNPERKVVSFQEKWEVPNVLVNSGIYVFNKRIKEYFSSGSIEEQTFQKLIKEGKLFGFYYDGIWLPINTPRELSNAEKYTELLDKEHQ